MEALIKDSEARFKFKGEVHDHPSGLSELTKYDYIHDCGRRIKDSSRSSTTTSKSGALGDKAMGQLQIPDGASVTIKVGNPQLLLVQEKFKTMTSGKKALDLAVSKMSSMVALLKAKATKGEANAQKCHDDMASCVVTLKTFIDNFLDTMGLAEAFTSEDDCSEMPEQMQDFIDRAVIHCDGSKNMLKRYTSTWRPQGE